ncbi:MAG: M28 family peptidase [Candidatus Promineifilaceae bacterium]
MLRSSDNDQPAIGGDREASVTLTQPVVDERSSPVGGRERIEVVDILRGFAIFGILLVNMYGFAGMALNPQNYSGLDRVVVILILLFAQAKFYSLFSFLFGWGMWIQMSRAIAKGVNFVPLYIRRMLVLLAIGILHGIFIWTGDILTVYAILGLLLLLFRNSSERTLLIAIALLLLLPMIVNLPGEAMNSFREGYAELADFLRTFGPQADTVYGNGTYRQITERRFQGFIGGQTWFIYWIGNVFAMFLLGFYAGKRGYFHNISKHLPTFRRTMWTGLVVGLLLSGISVLLAIRPDLLSPEWRQFVRISTRTVGAPALMLFYVSAITLLSQREAWHSRLAPLAPVGRMALTNYLVQSLVLTLIFYGYGLGLYGEIGPTAGLILTILVYLSQIRFSAWWLERYRFGPMEWLWRTLTYGRFQQLRRRGSSSEPRPIPGLTRVRRLLSAIHPLVLLSIVWLGLLIWSAALIRWNSRLSSEVYADPFTYVAEAGAAQEPGEAQTSTGTEVETTGQETEIVAFMPEVQPVAYNPGSIVSSGDMLALANAFDVSRALEHVDALSRREFSGRLAGSPGGQAAGEYIADKMADYGLQPGGYDGSYYQPFPITYTLLLAAPELAVTGPDGSLDDSYELYEDFAPFISGYAGDGEGSGEVYWVNYCRPEDFYGLDVVGKIVFCHAAASGSENTASSRRAIEYGADGLLFLTDPQKRPPDFGYRHAEVWVPRSIPVLFVYPEVAADLFENSGEVPSYEGGDSEPFLLETQAQLNVPASGAEVVEARNILGVLPGRDSDFKDEVVVIGAHYDHMGQGPDGTYWPGANDNASGVAAMLEIARSWQEQGYVPRRTVVFGAWDAEEWGLIGSTTYVFHPSYPLENTVASIQLDMVGAGSDTLNIGGNTSLSRQLQDVADALEVEAEISDLGRSDHVPFMQAGIPASLLIWLAEDVVIPHYHRPADQPAVIEPEKLIAASKVAEITLLELVESEPAIRSMLATRANAVAENDQALFLSTSRQDQLVSDSIWLADLQSYTPSTLEMTVDNLEIEAGTAVGDIRMKIEYPDPEDRTITLVMFADLPVQFSRQGSDWTWAGPSLKWAEEPEGESDLEGSAAIPVAYPRDIDANLWPIGVEAARQYEEIANLLDMPAESESSILLLPDAEAIRVSTALSLPGDEESWIGPGVVKLVYRENISQSVTFSKAIAQMLLANAGVTEAAAPWLWQGLPVALQAEEDLVNTQIQHLPVLHRALIEDEVFTNESSAWAAVDYFVEIEGWDGLGRFITELGRACRQGSCDDLSGQDAALERIVQMDSETFFATWQEQWRLRLDAVQRDLDELLVARTNAVLAGDQQAFVETVYPREPALVSSELNWFADLFQHPLDSFSVSAHPVALLPNGDVLAGVTMSFRLVGGGDENIELTTLFKREGSDFQWAGTSLTTVSGPTIAIRHPEGDDQLASDLLADAEAIYAGLADQLGVESPEPLTIELFENNEEFRAAVALSFPAASWISGWSSDGTPIRLRLLPVSTAADYQSVLSNQLARQLLYQLGVQSEWLLKGVSNYLAGPLDGGVTRRVTSASLPELLEAATEDRLYDFRNMPDDARANEVSFELSRVQSWDSIRYLIETYGWGALLELLSEHGAGSELDSAMRATLGESLSSFAADWETSLEEGHLPDDALAIVSGFDGNMAQNHVEFLASPELAGRLAGTEGADNAARYIDQLFDEYGLRPAGDISGTTYFQTFSITTTTWAQEPYFEVTGDTQPYVVRDEFLFSRATVGITGTVAGEMVWIGGSTPEGTDLSGKIVIAVASESVELQIEQAVSMGAEGLILLGIKDEIGELYRKELLNIEATAEIPVLELTKDGTLRLLETWGHTYLELSQLEDIVPLEFTANMGASFDEPDLIPTANVLGLLPGSDPFLSQELVILGAHYDHVGDDPPNVVCPDGMPSDGASVGACETTPGQRYSGSNDNASGVGVMLEIARLWQESGYRPKRSVLFAAWSAQEYGQLGSQNYVLTPTVPVSQSVTMIQLDGVGGGEGFFPGIQGNPFRDMLPLHYAGIAANHLGEELILSDPISESDHLTFSQSGIPVLLVNWRLADENNLPDVYASGVNPERLTSTGTLAALLIMMLAQ